MLLALSFVNISTIFSLHQAHVSGQLVIGTNEILSIDFRNPTSVFPDSDFRSDYLTRSDFRFPAENLTSDDQYLGPTWQ